MARLEKGNLYLVKRGDTLTRIASRELGNARLWPEIARINGLARPYKIIAGLPLVIPRLALPSKPPQVTQRTFPDTSVVQSVMSALHWTPTIQDADAYADLVPQQRATPVVPAGLFLLATEPAPAIGSPTLVYTCSDEKVLEEYNIPGAKVTCKLTVKVSMQRAEPIEFRSAAESILFAKSIHKQEIEFERPLKANDPTSVSLKKEYGNELLSFINEVRVSLNAQRGTADFTFGSGFKLGRTEWKFTPPNKYEFAFEKREVNQVIEQNGTKFAIKGELSFVIEIETDDIFRVPSMFNLPIKIPEGIFELPKISKEDLLVAAEVVAVAAVAAVAVILFWEALPILAASGAMAGAGAMAMEAF